jgi:error-prone DNA polymerase
MAHDYRLLSLSVEGHPMQHLRPLMPPEVLSIRNLRGQTNGETVTIAGIVTTRQRPETAKGILFLLVEDETGTINVVVRKEIHEAHRELYRAEPFIIIQGLLDRREGQHNLVAEEAWSLLEVLPDPVKSASGRRVHQAITGLHTPRPHNFR